MYITYYNIEGLTVAMNEKLKTEQMDALFNAILSLKNLDECYAFFEDLCTVTELKSIEQRFEVAMMLSRGHVYGDVVRATGASTATISRVNRSLQYGAGGYSIVFDRLKEDKE